MNTTHTVHSTNKCSCVCSTSYKCTEHQGTMLNIPQIKAYGYTGNTEVSVDHCKVAVVRGDMVVSATSSVENNVPYITIRQTSAAHTYVHILHYIYTHHAHTWISCILYTINLQPVSWSPQSSTQHWKDHSLLLNCTETCLMRPPSGQRVVVASYEGGCFVEMHNNMCCHSLGWGDWLLQTGGCIIQVSASTCELLRPHCCSVTAVTRESMFNVIPYLFISCAIALSLQLLASHQASWQFNKRVYSTRAP